MRRFAWIFPLLFVGAAAVADDEEELRRLNGALDALDQEQQAIYQQFQMVQELRRANGQMLYDLQFGPARYATELPSYSDIIEAQRSAVRRGEELARQADELYARFGAVEAKKEPMRQRIQELLYSK